MATKKNEPKQIRPQDIDPKAPPRAAADHNDVDEPADPHHNWERPLQSPGHNQVDFEERIDFRRLHDYRLARVRAALARSGLGALLSFDQHNIRYTTSTVIGEWARDKLTRYSLLTGAGERNLQGCAKVSPACDSIREVCWLAHNASAARTCRANMLRLPWS